MPRTVVGAMPRRRVATWVHAATAAAVHRAMVEAMNCPRGALWLLTTRAATVPRTVVGAMPRRSIAVWVHAGVAATMLPAVNEAYLRPLSASQLLATTTTTVLDALVEAVSRLLRALANTADPRHGNIV